MKVSAVMSSPVFTVSSGTTVSRASELMREHDVGALPIVDGGRTVGIVTDRDMVVAVLARWKKAGELPVSRAMSSDLISCRETQSIAEAAAMMGDAQVERLIVVDQDEHLVGIISVGDIAVNASEVLAGQAVGEICEFRKVRGRGHRIRLRE